MNQPAKFDRLSLLLSAVFAMLLIVISGGMAVYILTDEDIHQAYKLVTVASEIDEIYSGQVDRNQLIVSARQAIFDKLDRYSGYVEAREYSQMDEELSGAYGGIGVTVVRHNLGLLVMSVREGGPAAQVGLLSGDIITGSGSVRFGGVDSDDAIDHLRGPIGDTVLVSVYRPVSQDTLSLRIVRSRIQLLHVPFAGFTPDSMVYIRVLDFEAGTTDDIADALDSLMHRDSLRPRGVILDLRGNPGGLFSEAYRTANLFLSEGQFIVGTDSRSRWDERKYYSSGTDLTGGLPMAVIVDRGSASSAEIVSGSLHQLGRAMLVGDTTFGKGLVQGFTRFDDGSGLRLTISRYYLEGGIYLNAFDSTLIDTGSGLPPDHYYRFVERREFPRALENSLLLQQFANRYQDSIVDQSQSFDLDNRWVHRFAEFATGEGFLFRSGRTEAAGLLMDISVIEQSSREVIKAARDILLLAQKDDMDQFQQYHDYIRTRLKQLAYERKFGTYRTYAEVIVRERPDIQFAAGLLKTVNP